MSKRKPPLSPEDQQLLDEALKGTKRIVHDKVNLRQQQPKRDIPKWQKIEDPPSTSIILEATPEVTGDAILEFARNGISVRELKRLRNGHFTLESELDLHGFGALEAEAALASFFTRALQRQNRFVRIIHGQGYGSQQAYPVIKNLVNQFLRSHPKVLAFCTAPPNQGGRGAVNVLLKYVPIAPEA